MFGRSVSPEPTMYDVVTYINSVKDAFHDEPAKYDGFLKLFIDVRVLRVYVPNDIARMKELIKDHQNLLLRLNVFLPAEAQITIPPEAEAQITIPSEADHKAGSVPQKPIKEDLVSYLTAVKEAFHDDPPTYDVFYKLIYNIRHHRVLDIASAIGRVDELLQDHQDLLLRLNDFLSAEAQRILHLKIEKGAASDDNKRKRVASFLSKLKARFQWDDRHVYESFLEILNMYQEGNKSIVKMYQEIVSLVQDHEDLVMEFADILS
ncbi:PREDICTED: paired amphipathic helix protein Sin3-like 4 [Camelina sativa]|uniref:Paired amphipathic helix protein Sin3-like 4 n=1 Tax=Camelina sativa TaxID=90675 RepID=A0ABM0YIU4_CAMSA|nr:PREDICTED: paired amphipathic helix protein Sin3-like 4 [Camelina sativa]